MKEEQLSKIEKKTKLNRFEKRAFKKFIQKARKQILKAKQNIKDEHRYRTELEKQIIEFTDILEIEDDNGKELTDKNIKEFSTEELEETFEKSLIEVEKLL